MAAGARVWCYVLDCYLEDQPVLSSIRLRYMILGCWPFPSSMGPPASLLTLEGVRAQNLKGDRHHTLSHVYC